MTRFLILAILLNSAAFGQGFRHAFTVNAGIKYERFRNFTEMSLHNNIRSKSRQYSEIYKMRNDAIGQSNPLWGMELCYSSIKRNADKDHSYMEYRFGLAYTMGYSFYIEGGYRSFQVSDSSSIMYHESSIIDMSKISASAEILFSGQEWHGKRVLGGARVEAGSFSKMRYQAANQRLRFKTPLLVNIQLLGGFDVRLHKGLSFRVEMHAGAGQLFFLGGSNYIHNLFSTTGGLRYAW